MVSPQPSDAPRRARRTWLAATLVLVLLAWFGGAAAFGLTASELPRTTASSFVPADAYRDSALFDQGGMQSQAMLENARVRGPTLGTGVSPYLFRYMVLPPGVTRDQGRDVQWWRESLISGASGQPARYRVFSTTEDGVRMHGQDWGTLGLTLEPAPLWLPADVHAGKEWTGKGIATGAGLDGLLDYRMTARASQPRQDRRAAEGCVQVRYTTTFDPREPDSTSSPTTWSERNVWCPGRGIVDSTGSVGGFDYAVSTADGRAAEPLPDNAEEQRPDTAGVEDWQQRKLVGNDGDETFGLKPMRASIEKIPVVTATGSIAYRSGSTTDLVGLLPVRSGEHWLHWWVRPGGHILSLTAVGRMVVVTTSERQMLAYAPGGRLLWQKNLDDVALRPPVRVGRNRLAVASVAGEVSLHSAVTGRELWTRRLPQGVSQPLASDGSMIAAVDNEQEVHALDARTGARRWTTEGGLASTAPVVVADGVTVVSSGGIRAYDNRTGRLRWYRGDQVVRWPTDVQVNDRTLAVDGDYGVRLLDLEDGHTVGSIPGARSPRAVGDTWFALTAKALVAADEDGARRRAWRFSVPATDRQLVVGATGVWVFGRTGEIYLAGEWVGPRG